MGNTAISDQKKKPQLPVMFYVGGISIIVVNNVSIKMMFYTAKIY